LINKKQPATALAVSFNPFCLIGKNVADKEFNLFEILRFSKMVTLITGS